MRCRLPLWTPVDIISLKHRTMNLRARWRSIWMTSVCPSMKRLIISMVAFVAGVIGLGVLLYERGITWRHSCEKGLVQVPEKGAVQFKGTTKGQQAILIIWPCHLTRSDSCLPDTCSPPSPPPHLCRRTSVNAEFAKLFHCVKQLQTSKSDVVFYFIYISNIFSVVGPWNIFCFNQYQHLHQTVSREKCVG